jgi:hypothetical protein
MQLEQQQLSIGIDGNYWIKTLRSFATQARFLLFI